jgi:hypothetical protein
VSEVGVAGVRDAVAVRGRLLEGGDRLGRLESALRPTPYASQPDVALPCSTWTPSAVNAEVAQPLNVVRPSQSSRQTSATMFPC